MILVALASVALAPVQQKSGPSREEALKMLQKLPSVPDGKKVDIDQTRRVMADYARCVVNRLGFKVKPALAEPVGSPVFPKIFMSDAGMKCLTDVNNTDDELSLSFKPYLMRGPIFEELYRLDFRSRPGPDFAAVPATNYPYGLETSTEAQRYRLAMVIGDCVVRATPAEVRALISTKVASAEEKAAIAGIVPSISGCVPQGQSMTFSKVVIRGMLAEPLYRLTDAARSAPHA